MTFSAALFREVVSSFQRDAEEMLRKHDPDNCDGCQFSKLIEDDPELSDAFNIFVNSASDAYEDTQGVELVGFASLFFILGRKVGRREVLEEQLKLEIATRGENR